MPRRFGLARPGAVKRTRKAWVGALLAGASGAITVAQDATASGAAITVAALASGFVTGVAVYWTANDGDVSDPEE